MAELYNKVLEEVQNYADQTKLELTTSPFWKSVKEAPIANVLFKDCGELSLNANWKNICKFIKNANNGRKCEYKYDNKIYVALDYEDRRLGVIYLTAFSFVIGLLRRRAFKSAFKTYFMLSMLICRENFNFKSYQIQI
jgi:hypothetical protein